MPYMLYETATGRPISQSSALPSNVAAGRTVKEVPDYDGIWNESTLVFDPLPETRIIDKSAFLDLFTEDELEAIVSSANIKVKVFIKKLEMAPKVDLKSSRMITALNGMEALSMISSGRAAEILNG